MQQETINRHETMRRSQTKMETLKDIAAHNTLNARGTMGGDDFSRATSPLKDQVTSHRTMASASRPPTIDEREILDIMKKIAIAGKVQATVDRIKMTSPNNYMVTVGDMMSIWRTVADLEHEDAWRLNEKLEQGGSVNGS